MLPTSFSELGIIKKPHGSNGYLRAVIYDELAELIKKACFIFIEHDGILVPYFLEDFSSNKHFFLKFEDINDSAKAENYKSKLLYIDSNLTGSLVSNEEMESSYGSIIGYTAFDNMQKLGSVVRIDIYPEQEIAILKIKTTEHMIPLNEQLIEKVDTENKQIFFNLPSGLLSL